MASTNTTAITLPIPSVALSDPTTNGPSRPWYYWFLTMQQRTGGASGQFGPPTPVTLQGSPLTFTAPSAGSLIIRGGGVVRLQFNQSGSKWFDAGQFYAPLPMRGGAQALITYVGTPTVVFVPGP